MIDIIIPVYNEGKNIKKLFDGISKNINSKCRLLIVYDSEEDNTLPIVKTIKNSYNFNIKLVKNIYGKGALNAIKTGLKSSTHQAILVMMADLCDDLRIVDKMYRKIKGGGYNIVCGSRYMKGGKQIGGPRLKKILSRMAGISLHYIIGIPTHDITNSFKMYSREIIDTFEIESTGGFEIGMELTIKAYISGFKITEIPSTWKDRIAGESNFKMWKWIPKYIYWYLYAVSGRFNSKFHLKSN